MELSNDLISQFAKITKDDKPKKETAIYGTIVKYGGDDYVKIDGSELLTPITSTAAVKDGERVMVTIEKHSATVTGNISSPSASNKDVQNLDSKMQEFEVIVADKVSTKDLEAEKGRINDLVTDTVVVKEKLTANEAEIDELKANDIVVKGKIEANKALIDELEAKKLSADVADIKYATIEKLEATEVDVRNLEADYGDFKALSADKFSANEAKIKDLEAKKLSATDADIKYANIDFSNIGNAAMEHLYANSGLIKDVIIDEGTITGNLVGVTIKGDIIEGGTVVADKLVIKGADGLYYKLNTNGVTTESEQTDYNSLNGSIITAKSITATKIAVEDLVAFDATIGGFNITSESIYSGVKESVDNTTKGIYLDKDGQVAIGDSNHFIKYYRDSDGSYKLAISAESITFESGKKSINDVIKENSEKAINDIDIGGTNLLLNTLNPVLYPIDERISIFGQTTGTYFGNKADNNDSEGVEVIEHGYKIVFRTGVDMYPRFLLGTNSSINKDASLNGLIPGQTYTLSCDVMYKLFSLKTSGTDYFQIVYSDDSDVNGTFAIKARTRFIAEHGVDHNTWISTGLTFTVGKNATKTGITISASSNDPSYYDDGDYIAFRNIKLEKGNKATDWSPAPEDFKKDYDDKIADNANDLKEAIYSELKILGDEISSIVTDNYYTKEEAEDFIGSRVSKVTQTANDLTIQFKDFKSDIDAANTKVDALDAYFRFDSEGYLHIGKTDSDFELVLNNEKISFLQSGKEIAYIKNTKLYIDDGQFLGSLRVGNYAFVPRDNGSLDFKKVGD